jgi:hypothetical protein
MVMVGLVVAARLKTCKARDSQSNARRWRCKRGGVRVVPAFDTVTGKVSHRRRVSLSPVLGLRQEIE